jgi:Conjugal transfer protein
MEGHMKHFFLAAIMVSAFPAGAQTTNFNQVQHIQTALDHLTVVDLGEPVADLAVADRDAFQIERHDNKVFIMPLREGVATNLFIWTASRQLDYEIDPAGDLAKMNVLIRDLPQPVAHVAEGAPSDQEIQKVATLVLSQALIGTEEISHDEKVSTENQVHVELNQVFRSKNLLYIRYTITNSSKDPFRVTPPDVFQPSPTQTPISLLSLRNHQLSEQTFAAFKVRLGSSLSVANAQSQVTDLAPGQKTTGILSIPGSPTNPPHLYKLQFGTSQSKPIAVEAVL